jgi:glutathione S-transferase
MNTTIFGTSQSRAFRVLWAAKELSFPFEHEPTDWQTCAKNPDYLAINPAGSVPCLKEDDFVLAESLAINIYLAKKYSGLWPATSSGQAVALQWSFWAATTLEEPYVRWALHSHWLPKHLRDEEVAKLAMNSLSRPLSRLDAALSGNSWLIEGNFTIADLNVASVISLLNGPTIAEWPNVYRWLSACVQRPAFKAAAALP